MRAIRLQVFGTILGEFLKDFEGSRALILTT